MKPVASVVALVALLAVSSAVRADDSTDDQKTRDAPLPTTSTTAQPGVASTTTTTSSDATVTPMPNTMASPQSKETTTLYQSVRPNKAYLFTGGALLVGAYAPTAVLTAANPDSDRSDKTLYLPVVGPWLHLADRDCRTCSSGENTLDTVLIAGSGVLQGAGLILMTASLFVPEKVPAATIQAGNVKMTFTATGVGRNAATFGAVGTF